MTALFIGFEQCPQCKSKGRDQHGDNLGIWDDGHKWCFSCHYYEPGTNGYKLISRVVNKTEVVTLPKDYNGFIPQEGLKWLMKFKVDGPELFQHRIGWSRDGIWSAGANIKPLLIFPIYDRYGHLLMWQGRNFGTIGPKYFTKGDKETILHILGEREGKPILLVEDLVSAIKTSNFVPTMPLFGNSMSKEKILRLSGVTKSLIIWLDPGMEKKSIEFKEQLAPFFETIDILYTDRDPKEYHGYELRKMLKNTSKTAQDCSGDDLCGPLTQLDELSQ